MLGRFISLGGVSVLCALACGGGAFSSASDGDSEGGSNTGSGGKVSGNGGKSAGGKASGGTGTMGGSASGGAMANGGAHSGGMVSTSGTGGSTQAGSGGSVVVSMCQSPDDCPTSNSCHEPSCEGGVCDEVEAPDGPFHLQVRGDCKRMECEAGEEKVVVDPSDSNDDNECTVDSCSQDGVATHKARFGEVCGNGGGTCNGEGKCELCDRNLCPAVIPCYAAICGNGSCQLAPRPAGDLCPLVSPNDASDAYGQCDGAGVCVDCVTNGGCGECCRCSNDRTCIPA